MRNNYKNRKENCKYSKNSKCYHNPGMKKEKQMCIFAETK